TGPGQRTRPAWGAETGSCGGSEFVFVDEAAEEVGPLHACPRRRRVAWSCREGGCRVGWLEVERAVRPPVVVMANVDAEDVLDPAAADREEDEHVQTLKPDGVDGQEVAGEHRVAMLAQEGAPALPVALGCRRDAGVSEHAAHQRRRNVDAELAQLADDSDVAPACVLAREPQ